MSDQQLTSRAATPDDVPAWARLDQRACAADGRDGPWSADELAEEIDTDWAGLDTRSRVLVRPDGELAAVAWLDAPPGSARVYTDLEVDPADRDRLLAPMLDWLIEHAEGEKREGRLPDAEQIEVVTTPTMTDRNELLRNRGFHPARHWQVLRRDLAEPIGDHRVPDGVTVVGWDDAGSEAVRQAHNTAFRDHWGNRELSAEEWRSLTTGAVARSDLHRIALADGAVVGHAICVAHPDEWEAKGVRDAWIKELGTLPEWRGRGVASALLVAVMTAMAGDGLTHASLGVDSENPTGATRLYAAHGFAEVSTLISWHRPVGADGIR